MPRKILFCDRIRTLFIESGYSRADLQKATGLDRSAVSRFVRGERFLSETALNAVAEFLHLEVSIKRKKNDG
jgi:transcriptional regulator with XRE-family HTH domain